MCIRDSSYTIIDGLQGKGQFVGVTLAPGMNGNNTCWVEGEARMYLDDDKYPSIHYTGTDVYKRQHFIHEAVTGSVTVTGFSGKQIAVQMCIRDRDRHAAGRLYQGDFGAGQGFGIFHYAAHKIERDGRPFPAARRKFFRNVRAL